MGTTFTTARDTAEGVALGVDCGCRSQASCDCEDFDYYRVCEHTEDLVFCRHRAIEVSVTGSNAQRALDAMGLVASPDGYGHFGVVDAYDFATRARQAAARCLVDGDRDMADRLGRLMRLGIVAHRQQAKVGWS